MFLAVLLTLVGFPAGLNARTAAGVDAQPAAPAATMSYVGEAYGGTSVNTAVFRANSVVSFRRWQYVAYYDDSSRVVVARRRLPRRPAADLSRTSSDSFVEPLGNPDSLRMAPEATKACERRSDWTVTVTPYRGNVRDAHNVISLGVDGKGRLHLSFDQHGQPLKYCRGLRPGSMQFGPLEPMTGLPEERDVTYPEFHRLSTGDLLFVYRSGESGRGNLVMNRYNLSKGTWSQIHRVLLDGENQRNAYWQLCVDARDVIHLSWVWRESWRVETNHDLCYACSRDGGLSWQRSDGTPYELPITFATSEVAWPVPQRSELINQTSMTADTDGHPYIATYWRDADSDVPQYRLVWHDGRSWNSAKVGERHEAFSLSGGGTKMIPIARPRLVVDGRNRAYYLFRDVERGCRVSMAFCPDIAAVAPKWQVSDLTGFPVDAWEPSIDVELWKDRGRLCVFVQATSQGDGERALQVPPGPVYVMEVTDR